MHSNRIESLLSALLEVLPAPDPFAPSTIVVGSQLIARWLSREIAVLRGIAAGIELVTFDAFVEATWAGDPAGRTAGLGALDRRQLAAALASVLADDSVVKHLGPVAAYLAAAPAPGDRAGPRRVQLAEHLAELVWSYALSRPDWMPALMVGQIPSEIAADPAARWQAALIGAAITRLEAVPTPMLPWLRRRAGLTTPARTPVAVFGLSFLARAQLEALTDLSATTEVTVYALDPCEELWDDVAGRRAADVTTDPLPLVLWGRPVRDTLSALVERTGGDLEARFGVDEVPDLPDEQDRQSGQDEQGEQGGQDEQSGQGERDEPGGAGRVDWHPATARTPTARDLLLADVRMRRAPSLPVPGEPVAAHEAGVVVLACPNARREIEVVAAEVRRRLDADPTLRAHEIAVWIAGDAERYLAQAPSAFEAVGVPCHLIDAPIDDRGRVGEAVLAILELPTSTMARRDLLRVMTHPAVLAGYPHVDAEDWVRWTERLGIVHGSDSTAHAGTYLEDHPGLFHWDQGVRRLALGAFMVGERAERGAARIASFEVAPEELRPEHQASAATYALLVRSLCGDAAWLAMLEAPLATWAEVFARLVDDYLAPRDEDATRDLERVRALLAGIAHVDRDGRSVGFREAREHAVHRLASARANRGEPLAAGVMIAPLAAMRAVPFRVAFIAGLNEGAFPAGDHTSPLDLRREPRVGDVAPRDRDRAAFLDVLLGTREALYLSYVAIEDKSGQPLAPSSVVLELGDALAPYLGAASSRDALAAMTVRHPLHRYGGTAPQVLPAVGRERWGMAVRDALRAHLRAAGRPIPDADGQLALLAHPAQAALRAQLGIVDPPAVAATAGGSRPLTVANLRGFLEYPIQAWAQAVLGLDELPDDEAVEHSDEPFHLGRAERAVMLREVFAAQLREPGGPVDSRYDTAVKDRQLRGQFPVGVFAEAARALDLEILQRWRDGLGPIVSDGATRIGFGRASSPGAELLPALSLDLSGGRTVRLLGQTELLVRGKRYTSIVTLLRKLDRRSHYHLRGAFDHLLLAAAGLATGGHTHRVIDDHGNVCEVQHDPWTAGEARGYLTSLVTELLDQPHGYLLPFEALAKALQGGKPSARYGDPTAGLGYGPIDRADGLEVPGDAIQMARRRLLPLVQRMHGDHGFEVGP
ncbi:MAG TPA: exodeoxyribonuclease V subunit gamma [Kofleriaceae bacterium]|nr:exodeoxyribonuclease V subunit gamma [Kofleriaceae bacterium]